MFFSILYGHINVPMAFKELIQETKSNQINSANNYALYIDRAALIIAYSPLVCLNTPPMKLLINDLKH